MSHAIEVRRTFHSDEHDEEQQDIPCPMCGTTAADLVLRSPDLLFDRPGKYNLVRCKQCDLEYVNPRPTPQALGAHYPDDYMCYIPPEESHWLIRPAIVRFARGLFIKRMKLIERVIGRITPETKIVDVGCGQNDLLYTIQQQRGCTGIGLDFKKEVVDNVIAKRKMPMVLGTLETAGFSEGQFDVMTMMEYLEHEPFPLQVLKQARRAIKTGGHLCIEVPYVGWPARFFKGAWFNLDLPRHLVFFTPKTMERALNEAGFELVNVKPFGLPFYVGSSILHALGYRFSAGFQFGPLFASLIAMPLLPFTALVPECMMVVARAK